MYLNSRDADRHNDPSPFAVSYFAVWGETELGFNQGCSLIGFSDRKTKTVALRGAGTNIPEFGQVLRRVEQFRPTIY